MSAALKLAPAPSASQTSSITGLACSRGSISSFLCAVCAQQRVVGTDGARGARTIAPCAPTTPTARCCAQTAPSKQWRLGPCCLIPRRWSGCARTHDLSSGVSVRELRSLRALDPTARLQHAGPGLYHHPRHFHHQHVGAVLGCLVGSAGRCLRSALRAGVRAGSGDGRLSQAALR